MSKGRLIVIDGLDGCGKTTQFELLKKVLPEDKYTFISFPNYNSETGKLISKYLRGELDLSLSQIDKLYAADRFVSYLSEWKRDYEAGKTIIAARYTTSMQIYTAAKYPVSKRYMVINDIANYEYLMLGLPIPYLMIYLKVDKDTFLKNLENRHSETGDTSDIHEADIDYMQKCYDTANYLSLLQPAHPWHTIECCDSAGEMRTVEDIHKEILELVR